MADHRVQAEAEVGVAAGAAEANALLTICF